MSAPHSCRIQCPELICQKLTDHGSGHAAWALGGTGMLPFEGVRVIEVAAWTFVPAVGAALADLGADVIKIEPPGGDPQRGLMNMLARPGSPGANPFVEIPNRGKRSMTLDLASAEGHALLLARRRGAARDRRGQHPDRGRLPALGLQLAQQPQARGGEPSRSPRRGPPNRRAKRPQTAALQRLTRCVSVPIAQ